MKKTNVREQILTTAESLIQTQGYNAFSFRDIAEAVGIKTASIHYHFPTKAELGKAVIERHTENLHTQLTEVMKNPSLSCKKKLHLFLDGIFASTYAANNKMCLGGMLASDVLTLPESIQSEVRIFFNRLEKWLELLLIQGRTRGEFNYSGQAKAEAEFILSLLEGSLLLARLYKNEGKLMTARRQIERHLF